MSATEVKFCVAKLEVVVRSTHPDGLTSLGGYYDHYPSSGQPPGLIMDIETVPQFSTGRQRGPEYPAFRQQALEPGRVALSRFDAEGEISLPRNDPSEPVRGHFRVGESQNSVEAVVRIGTSLALPRMGGLVLHASAVASGGEVWLFAGLSGAGKSTIAAMIAGSSSEFTKISDELVIVTPAEPDGWVAHVSPFIGSKGLPHGEVLPVAGIHFLSQAGYHRRTLLSRTAGLRELLKHVLVYVSESDTASRVLDAACGLTARVPCYHLEFSKDLGVLEVL